MSVNKKLTKLDFSSAVEKDHLIMRKMSPFEFKNEKKRKEKGTKRRLGVVVTLSATQISASG